MKKEDYSDSVFKGIAKYQATKAKLQLLFLVLIFGFGAPILNYFISNPINVDTSRTKRNSFLVPNQDYFNAYIIHLLG